MTGEAAMIRLSPAPEEATLLEETAERFLADNYTLPQRNAMLVADPGTLPRHWCAMAELGWLAAPLPEELGGLGLDAPDVLPLLQTLGAGLVLEPLGPAIMHCSTVLARLLPPAEAQAALAPMLSGRQIDILADGTGRERVTARQTGTGWQLSGTLSVVPGVVTGVIWTAAQTDTGPVLCRVPAAMADITAFRLTDGQPAARIVFDNVTCMPETVTANAAPALAEGADAAAFARIAEAAGLISALHAATLEYVKSREQFGRPIGRFQVIQHRMADMFIAREESLSMAHLAAEAMAGAAPEKRRRLLLAAQVKVFEHGRAVLRDAVQLHGGMGMTDEMRLGHMVKRLMVLGQIGQTPAAGLRSFSKLP